MLIMNGKDVLICLILMMVSGISGYLNLDLRVHDITRGSSKVLTKSIWTSHDMYKSQSYKES